MQRQHLTGILQSALQHVTVHLHASRATISPRNVSRNVCVNLSKTLVSTNNLQGFISNLFDRKNISFQRASVLGEWQ